MKELFEAIKEADPVEVDTAWAVLKYKNIGILRKLKSLCLIFDLDEEGILDEAPKDESGRILDHETRHAIHDELILVSQNKTHE
ncbi:hypothetical protein N9955_00345 [bacterium]|nr:hypothetical protein [bacterium]